MPAARPDRDSPLLNRNGFTRAGQKLTKLPVTHPKAALALAVLLILALPTPHRVAPAWSMKLVDQFGVTQAGVPTTQTWRHLAYQPDKLSETRRSDERGRVAFPERRVWGSTLRYLYGVASNLARNGTDAGFGPDVWVFAKESGTDGGCNVYTPGQAPPDTLVIHRYGVCVSIRPARTPAADPVPGRPLDRLGP